jgi:hypothetical protein
MIRSAVESALAVVFSAGIAAGTSAQTKPATPPPAPAPAAAPAPATKAKWVAPIKGDATVQMIKSNSRHVGKEIVTNFKIKNVSSGAIALFRIDEYWYDNSQKPQMITGDTQRYTKPIMPGEIIEMTTRSPAKPGAARSQWSFSHANGKIVPKVVTKFD